LVGSPDFVYPSCALPHCSQTNRDNSAVVSLPFKQAMANTFLALRVRAIRHHKFRNCASFLSELPDLLSELSNFCPNTDFEQKAFEQKVKKDTKVFVRRLSGAIWESTVTTRRNLWEHASGYCPNSLRPLMPSVLRFRRVAG
jgi:hypothetical protein